MIRNAVKKFIPISQPRKKKKSFMRMETVRLINKREKNLVFTVAEIG